MSGIQISGLLTNSAFDWKSVVDQLIAADSAPVTALTNQKTTNTGKVTALSALQTALTDLQSSIQAIRAGNLFAARNVTSDTSGTTWVSNSATGAAIGSYKIAVQQLATNAGIQGAADLGQGLSGTSDVSGVTLATLATATPVTAGTFTVDGQQVTAALTDSLQDVFDKIQAATGGEVTAAYDPSADAVTLTRSSGELLLGAVNDTSNFLQVMKLANGGGATSTSSASLGTLQTTVPLASAGLRATVAPAAGTFTVNGVAIAYDLASDSLGALLNRISQSGAGVNATYDPTTDRVNLVNTQTGDIGIALGDSGTGLLDALGLTGDGTFVHGKNALFTVNGGAQLSSASNTLGSAAHGITGLSVTVNSATTQTVSVGSDVASMQNAIQAFLDKFNAVQDLIDTDTKVDISTGTPATSVLSDNREVQDWASQLRSLAFNSVSGVTGSVQRLDNLGIDFDGTTGHLTIKNPDTLDSALSDHPDDVQKFFLTASTGFVSQMFTKLTGLIGADAGQQSSLAKANTDIDAQVATLQGRLDAERTTLTNAFIQMLDAQSAAQSQSQTLTSAFFQNNSSGSSNTSSCWVARAVFGPDDPRWLAFRFWLLERAPAWFRWLYLRYGERFAAWLRDKPALRRAIRRWMAARIAGLARN